MPAVNFSPIMNAWQGFTPSGLPLSLGFIQTYQAGTSTPLATYTTSAGTIANSNPIALLADGRPPQEIWLLASNAYKFVLLDSALNQIGTYDNITGIDNTVPAALSEWVISGLTPSFVSATQFTLAGNQTALFEAGRRVRYTLGSGQYTGSITTSVFGALTTVTIVTDSIPLDNTLSAVDYGFLDALKPSVPTAFKSAVTAPSATIAGVSTLSGGVVFAGGAGNLNWYEAPTAFTPVLSFGGASVGITYNINRSGIYERVGNTVFFRLRMRLTNKGSSVGSAAISGFPYSFSVTGASPVFPATADSMLGLSGAVTATAGLTSIGLVNQTATTLASLTDANFTNTSDISVSGSYQV